jgi:hypothetical protein
LADPEGCTVYISVRALLIEPVEMDPLSEPRSSRLGELPR